jgi:hypothetical protein
MAVVVQCYHCNTILELDEGFRGGVCRCSTCGSLLQVPKASTPGAPKARPAAPGAQPTEPKRPATPPRPGDAGISRGQFDPANQKNHSGSSGVRPATPDFGGSSSGLRQGRPAAPVATAPRKIEKVSPISGPTHPGMHRKELKKNNTLLFVGLALIGVILIIVVIVVGMVMMSPPERGPVHTEGDTPGKVVTPGKRGGKAGSSAEGPVDPGPAEVGPKADVKGFVGVPMTGRKILFSIDGASSMADSFDYVRRGVYRAVDTLEPGQHVQVAVWKGSTVRLFPASGFVDKSRVKDLRAEFDAVSVSGSSDAGDCMKASVGYGADQVVFVTAKFGLDSMIADGVMEAKKGDVRFDGIKIESEDAQSPLEMLASKTGGTYRLVSTGKLDQLTR